MTFLMLSGLMRHPSSYKPIAGFAVGSMASDRKTSPGVLCSEVFQLLKFCTIKILSKLIAYSSNACDSV